MSIGNYWCNYEIVPIRSPLRKTGRLQKLGTFRIRTKPVWAIVSSIFLILDLLVVPANSANSMYVGNRKRVGQRPLRCYSCMSTIYASIWEITSIDSTFFKQLDFTDKCQHPSDHREVRFSDCELPCVKMSESIDIAGSTVKVYIRGCFSSILRYGFNRTLTSRFLTPHCQNYTLEQLKYAPAPIGGNPNENNEARRKYNVCTCKTDLCNGANRISSSMTSNNWNLWFAYFGFAASRLLFVGLSMGFSWLANQWLVCVDHVTMTR